MTFETHPPRRLLVIGGGMDARADSPTRSAIATKPAPRVTPSSPSPARPMTAWPHDLLLQRSRARRTSPSATRISGPTRSSACAGGWPRRPSTGDARLVTASDGRTYGYDALVLATGSYAAKPPVPGNDLRGAFVYRTIDDVADLRHYVEDLRQRSRSAPPAASSAVAARLGGRGRTQRLGRRTTVVEFADRLMPAAGRPGWR